MDDKKTISLDELIALEEEQQEEQQQQDFEKPIEETDNRFYLPVTNLNHEEDWVSLPNSQRKYWSDKQAKETCLSNCCGKLGVKAACCQVDLDDLEHVLGPISEKWIRKTIKWFGKKNIKVSRHNLVIDLEEGKLIGDRFFNGHDIFKDITAYPILRLQTFGPRLACIFLNSMSGKCMIYERRPEVCKSYLCQYAISSFLVRTKNFPNTYKKLR